MFDLISHLAEKSIPHTISDHGRITAGSYLNLSGTSITVLPDGRTHRKAR